MDIFSKDLSSMEKWFRGSDKERYRPVDGNDIEEIIN
jgi:hypothetical protein